LTIGALSNERSLSLTAVKQSGASDQVNSRGVRLWEISVAIFSKGANVRAVTLSSKHIFSFTLVFETIPHILI